MYSEWCSTYSKKTGRTICLLLAYKRLDLWKTIKPSGQNMVVAVYERFYIIICFDQKYYGVVEWFLTMRSCSTWRFDSIILGKVWKSKFCDQTTQYQLRILQRFSSIFQGLKRKKRAPANVPASLDQPSTSSTSCEDQNSLLPSTCSPPDEIFPIQVTTFFNLFLCVKCHSVFQLPDIHNQWIEIWTVLRCFWLYFPSVSNKSSLWSCLQQLGVIYGPCLL